MCIYTIDRFEEDVAMLEGEDGTIAATPRALVPIGAREGDCLRLEGGLFTVDAEETERRAARIAALKTRLFRTME